jgi:uncharacterized protein (TIGR03437 family)
MEKNRIIAIAFALAWFCVTAVSLAFAQEGKSSGQLILKLSEKTFSQTSVSGGHRRATAPTIVGAVETHWLVASEKLHPNAKAAGFDRVVVADFSGSFMFQGLLGSKAGRKNAVALARRYFAGVADVVEENSSNITLAQAPTYPNDPLLGSQWSLGPAGIGIESTWTPASGLATVQTSDMLHVIIDSGVTPIPEIRNLNLALSQTFFGNNLPTVDLPTTGLMSTYPHGHGTMVASVACAAGNNGIGIAGIDWNCNLVSFKVFDLVDAGNGTTLLTTSYEAVLKAFVALLDLPSNHIVVNASFSMNADPSDPGGTLWKEAISALGDRGLVVVAAGNNSSTTAQYPSAFGLPNVFTLGSTNQSGRLSAFSNYGEWVDAAASGEGVVCASSDGTFPTGDGTSLSAPMGWGVAGLVWKSQLSLKSSELKQVISSGANWNPLLIGQVAGARQLSFQGAMNAVENLVNCVVAPTVPQISLLALTPAWTDQPGLTWGGLASAWGDNFTDGSEFVSATPVFRLGNISVFLGAIPLPLTYVGPHQVNFQLPEDSWQYHVGDNILSLVEYSNDGYVVSWTSQQGISPVAYNPGFLTGPDGKIFLGATDGNETVLYAVGLGFTSPCVRAGAVGVGTEQVSANVTVTVDGQPVASSATASSKWAGVYEVRIPTLSANAITLTIIVGDWQQQFLLQ